MEEAGKFIPDEITPNQILLKRRLNSLQMKEGTKVSEHLNTFNNILNQLESVDVRMEEEDKVITLLCTLLHSNDNLVTTLSCSKAESLMVDDIADA